MVRINFYYPFSCLSYFHSVIRFSYSLGYVLQTFDQYQSTVSTTPKLICHSLLYLEKKNTKR